MNNGFKGYHPIVNLIFFASVVIDGMLFRHPVTLFVCFSSAFCYYVRLCKKSALKSFFCFLLPALLFVVVFNSLFAHYGATPLLTLPDGNKLTFESIAYGFVLGVSTVTVIMWFFCYNEVVTTDKFMCVFGKVLPVAALVFSMALRFVPLYKERLHIIAEAQRGIGKDYKQGKFTERIRNAGKILSILATWALENAVETSDSMKARGYGLKGRKNYSKFRWSTSDVIAVLLMISLEVFILFGYFKKSVYCIYNPLVIINPMTESENMIFIDRLNLTVNSISVYGIITLTAFSLLCLLPLIIDLKEEFKWNRLKLKI